MENKYPKELSLLQIVALLFGKTPDEAVSTPAGKKMLNTIFKWIREDQYGLRAFYQGGNNVGEEGAERFKVLSVEEHGKEIMITHDSFSGFLAGNPEELKRADLKFKEEIRRRYIGNPFFGKTIFNSGIKKWWERDYLTAPEIAYLFLGEDPKDPYFFPSDGKYDGMRHTLLDGIKGKELRELNGDTVDEFFDEFAKAFTEIQRFYLVIFPRGTFPDTFKRLDVKRYFRGNPEIGKPKFLFPEVSVAEYLKAKAEGGEIVEQGQGESPQTRKSENFLLSPDGRSAIYKGQHLDFTLQQADIIKLLHDAYPNDASGQGMLNEIDSSSKRLRDTFKNHPAWNGLIEKSPARGRYRLNI